MKRILILLCSISYAFAQDISIQVMPDQYKPSETALQVTQPAPAEQPQTAVQQEIISAPTNGAPKQQEQEAEEIIEQQMPSQDQTNIEEEQEQPENESQDELEEDEDEQEDDSSNDNDNDEVENTSNDEEEEETI